jgi:DNA repair protein RecN (Recombination protein N)
VTQTPSPDGLPLSASGERYAYSQSGIDRVSFVVSFNPGEPLRPLDKVASGGETSRFLLALKSVLAEADGTPTLIFDEVDVGVGARAGMAVGERMRRLSQEHQVISITHLPQIAALADHHLSVTKSTANGHTGVTVRTLDSPQRVLEIAEMMSGSGTEAARRNARELLEAAQRM